MLEIKGDDLRIHDLYKGGKGLFHYINEIEPLPFENFISVESMDLTFITFYGNRKLTRIIRNVVGDDVTPENLQRLATMVYGMYFEKWKNLYEIYSERVDLDTYVNVTTETIKDDGTSTSDLNQSNKEDRTNVVAGYNDGGWADKDKNSVDGTDTATNKGTDKNLQEREKDTRGNLGNRLDDRGKAIEALKSEVIFDVIYEDVARMTGLLIF